jgi:hypothetical protein
MDAKHAKPTKPTRGAKSAATGAKATRSQRSTSSARPARSASSVKASRAKPGTERARDEQRQGGGPRYAGGPWQAADQRGDRRFGHTRIDDADPSELASGQAQNDDDESPSAADPDLAAAEAAGEIESGGQRAGMRRGEKPRKPKAQGR